MQDYIEVTGAKEHNLKNISIKIPKYKLVVITGLSGSGKSSLAFDTIYAEGQRRYVESLSAYARQFLEMQNKPEVVSISGLAPAIAIDQKTTSKNPRSTVGTITEIYDYLRLLFARIGVPYSPVTGKPISTQTISEVVDAILAIPRGFRIYILGPVARGEKGEFRREILQYKKQGFERIIIDGNIISLDNNPRVDKNKKHNIEIIVDRLVISDNLGNRVAESVEQAMKIGGGIIYVEIVALPDDQDIHDYKIGERISFSSSYACPVSGFQLEEIEPRIFSFNSPFGACPKCEGLGKKKIFHPDMIIPDKTLSINAGAIKPWDIKNKAVRQILVSLAKHYNFSLDEPFSALSHDIKQLIIEGSGLEEVPFVNSDDLKTQVIQSRFGGIVKSLEEKFANAVSDALKSELEQYMAESSCNACHGYRLKQSSLSVKIQDKHIGQVCQLSIRDTFEWADTLMDKLSQKHQSIAERVIREIKERLRFLINVGLDYLRLSRESATLSGGESQRIRLASQIGSGLTGVLYVLDEPSIGLHQRDNTRLINTLKNLRDLGNTVIVVEHDDETILSADYVIDMGPGAGIHGGLIISQGSVGHILNDPNSITGLYLSGKRSIPIPQNRRSGNLKHIELIGACANNLQNVDIRLPLGTFTVVTGVSGGGKSSLIIQTLYQAAIKHIEASSKVTPGAFKRITGLEYIDKIIDIDQSPIGRTPRSNPATYTGLFNCIRDWFAELPDSKARGYKISRFSFNVKGGRCEACQGDGLIKIEMHFLPDVYVKCDICQGRRYNRETLEIKYKDKSISDVLEMTSEDAMYFFEKVPAIFEKLKTMCKVGLGYIKIGQSATTLSGGEAQRIKLAKELSKRSTGKTLYILDEPTTGLHFEDVSKLLDVLHQLVDMGNTALVIEHNMDVIKTADYIIDVGPEGGDLGGRIVVTGTPEDVIKCSQSLTGEYLKRHLKKQK
jgi:excinuclease ABC subunit A